MSSPNSDDAENRQKGRKEKAASSSMPTTPATSLHQSAKRKSAFLPYRPTQAPQPAMVLTNLQRGNTEATFCPVEVHLSFHELAGQGEILSEEQLRSELSRCKTTIDSKDSYGFTALHYASFYGHLNTAKILVQHGADVNSQAPELVTPLLLAASSGHHDVVKFLLQSGAKSSWQDIMGNTALMYAAAGNHPLCCNELLAKDPDMTATNENNQSAYTLAIEYGAVLTQVLLEQYMTALLSL